MAHFVGIYAIRNRVTGAMYVGRTSDLRGRWTQHQGSLRRGRHETAALQRAWNEHGGIVAFELVTLEPVLSPRPGVLDAAERRWMLDLTERGVELYNRYQPTREQIAVVDWDAETMAPAEQVSLAN